MVSEQTEDQYKEGLRLFKLKEYQQCIDIFSQILDVDQENHRVWNAYGVVLHKLGYKQEAKVCFENAVILAPENEIYARNFKRLQQPQKTEPEVNKVSSKKPTKKEPVKVEKRPFTNYIIGGIGMIFFLFFALAILSMLFSPHPNVPSKGIVTPIPTASIVSTPVVTPTQTIATPIPTTILTVIPSPTPIPAIPKSTGGVTPTELKVHFIDVGQGDSTLLQSGGKTMLIDAGSSDAGPRVVSYLKSQGVKSLDVVAATHPHEDHIGGMTTVLTAFPVSLYVDNGATHTTSTYENLMKRLVSDNTPYAEVQGGKTIPFAPGITVNVLSGSTSSDLNQGSLVLKVTDGSQSFLLTGDSSTMSGDMNANILKVPHHGSNTALPSGYISRVNPEVAIISAGSGNSYGHPAINTITFLQNAGAKVYRTDTDGTVMITTDGSTYSIKTSKTGGTSQVVSSVPIPVYSAPVSTQVQTAPVQIGSTPMVTSRPTQMQSSSAVCDCSSDIYNAKDFPLSNGCGCQECFDYCKSLGKGDVHKLDRDKDGKVCE